MKHDLSTANRPNCAVHSAPKRAGILKRVRRIAPVATALGKQLVTGGRSPIYTGLFITERCNLRCVYCFPNSPNRKVKDPTLEELFARVDKLHAMGTRYITLLGGEPTIRNDFDVIVDYITSKGILTELGTNGYFSHKWIPSFKKLHLVCHSIDGNEFDHDANRGKGSFKKVLESLILCKENGIPVQMRSVFTKNNTGSLDYLLDLSERMGTSLALAEQAIVRQGDEESAMEAEALRTFWTEVRERKRKGRNIAKSNVLLDRIINFPCRYPVDVTFPKNEPLPEDLKSYMDCHLSDGYCFLDVDGMMYPCAPLFGKWGVDTNVHGIEGAWIKLKTERPCRMCRQSIMDLKSYFFGRNIASIMEGVRQVAFK